MRKKLLSIVLSAALVLGSVNITTLAAGTAPQETEDAASTVLETVEEEQEELTAGDAREGDEQAEERENVGLETEESIVQTTKEQSDEETVKQSAQENLRDDTERTEDSETAFSSEDASEIIIVEGELEGVYQFGDAPSERKAAVFSMRAAADEAAAEEYIYEQMKQRKTEIDISAFNLSIQTAQKVISGVLNEHPDLYFVEKGYGYSYSGSICLSINLTYDNTLDDNAFKKGVGAALSVVKPGMSDLEKAIALHDYLVVNCEYDKERLDAGEDNVPGTSHSAYGPLVNCISVCDGYALAYKYLLNQVGIECYMVNSASMSHAWNLIVLNGEYYQVDVTWDDPTWDLVGRAVHTYMFCSDSGFAKHSDWKVTKGGNVVDYRATSTKYDNAFWKGVRSPLVFAGDSCYYTDYDNTAKIKKTNLDDITAEGETVCDIGLWSTWGGGGYWQGAYSGLFCINNRLYYNDTTSINSVALDGTDKKTEFTPETTDGYIYGSALKQGKVYYSLHQTPNLTEKETVLEAAFDLPKGHITAVKTKTSYRYGETIDIDDLNVTYHQADGTSKTLESNEYTTNVSEIDTSVSGKKTLTITYSNPFDGTLTTTVELTVSQKEEGGGTDPSESETSPSEPGSEPGTNPSEPGTEPSEPVTEPSEPGTNPSEPGTEPSEPGTNPSESETDPVAGESDIQIVGLEKSYQYTGVKIIPAFDVIDYDIPDGKLLAPGVDYTVTYKDNKEPGIATIIVKGKGNYAAVKGNEAKATFKIEDANDAGDTPLANIKGAKITGGLEDADYNGAPHIPATITLTLKDKTTQSYTYDTTSRKYKRSDAKLMDVNIAVSNNINKGTANVLVSGVDDKGKAVKVKGKFKIKPIDLSQKTVEIEPGKAVYSPKGAIPETLKVTCEGKELKLGRDYTVKYAKNKTVGTGTVTVTGKGNYTKKVQPKDYPITAANMSEFRIAAVTANEGTTAGKIKATIVDQTGNALKAKQYTLEVYPVTVAEGGAVTVGTTKCDDTQVLEAGQTIHVVAVANDGTNLTTGTTIAADFTVGVDIAKAKFTLTPEAKKGIAYTGSEIRLEEKHFASVTYKDGTALHMKKADGTGDYEIVSCTNNVNKGTATAVIKGINGYSGTKTIKFKIAQKAITNIKLQEVMKHILEQLSGK